MAIEYSNEFPVLRLTAYIGDLSCEDRVRLVKDLLDYWHRTRGGRGEMRDYPAFKAEIREYLAAWLDTTM